MSGFQFDSLTAWLAMDGHGPYVWFCVVLVLLFFGGNVLALRLARRRFARDAAARRRRADARHGAEARQSAQGDAATSAAAASISETG
jgi:heme exporter protein D